MIVYNYSNTGEYIGESTARVDPLDDTNFLIPANATTIAPPSTGANEVAAFNGTEWVLTPDYRDITYYLISDGSEVSFDLGETPDGTVQLTFPQAVQDALDEQQRIAEINAETVARITIIVPAINSLEMIDFAVEILKSVDAVTLTPDMATANTIRNTGKTAITNGTALADIVWP